MGRLAAGQYSVALFSAAPVNFLLIPLPQLSPTLGYLHIG